ncbi:MAG: 30S ribosomal protein S13 [Chloroflexota bacterium]|nr:30S ribosomal protein S13 [Chloroflexota bacterium]MDE2909349.1 30S ribosomal protein S13 [Chloroflexota bacterium]
MARIEGVDLPREKRVVIGLTYIYGIGKSTSQRLLDSAGIDHGTRVRDLSESELQRIRELISGLTIEGDLRRQTQLNIKRLMEINSYRGLRHRRRLPVRGQRTRTNGRTRRGKKQTVAGRGRRRGATKK